MKRLVNLLVISLLLQLSATAQQQKRNILFEDFDLFTLKAIPQQTDSVPAQVRYLTTKSGKPRKLEVVLYKDDDKHPQKRKAQIIQNQLGTIIGFNMYKGWGFEKVLFFGARDQYHDSILIRHDTIFYKQLINYKDLYLQMILPVKNDSLVIKTIHIDYELGDYKYAPDILLKDYTKWFDKPRYDRSEIYTLAKAGDHFELIRVKTTGRQRDDDSYKYLQTIYRRSGLSPFWIAVWPNLLFL